MDAKEIKKRLLEDDRIEKLLEELECEWIKREQRGILVTAQLPDKFGSNNKRSVQVYLTEQMPAKIRTIGSFKGDIFSLVSFLKFDTDINELQSTFKKSLKFIADIFGWNLSNSRSSRKKDYVAPLKALASMSKNYAERVPNKEISERVLSNFRLAPNYQWYKEGISIKTQELYQVGYDYMTDRITIPIRNENGRLVGIKGRSINQRDVNDYNPKYKYLYRCNMSQEWFNMHIAKESIISEKKVFIFESEKSAMKMYTHGIKNTLAISSSDISEAQILMLKGLGIDIDIILCYDKDTDLDDIKRHADRITNRDVYAILDIEDMLGEKDSPIDKGIDVWNKLLNNHCYPVKIRD